MGYELTHELLMLGIAVFAVCTYIASRELSLLPAIFIAAVRTCIPVVYFAWYFDGTWTLTDDYIYFQQGQFLLDHGFTPLNVMWGEGFETLQGLAGGRHILYVWWNFTCVWLLGINYYAPVLINVVVTFYAGHLLAQLLKEMQIEQRYRNMLLVFFLLHWEIIAWSSFVNMKDSMVQLFTIALFYHMIRCVRMQSVRSLVLFLLCTQLCYWLRFYVPILILASAAAWLLLEWNDSRKFILLAGGGVVGMLIAPTALQYFTQTNPVELVYGAVHYLLTPQPWSVLPQYGFLEIPSVLHWVMFIPGIAGAVYLWREVRLARMLLIYFCILIVLYSFVEELQGMRHRVQIMFMFAWVQMHFLWRWNHAPLNQPVQQSVQAKHVAAPHMQIRNGAMPAPHARQASIQ